MLARKEIKWDEIGQVTLPNCLILESILSRDKYFALIDNVSRPSHDRIIFRGFLISAFSRFSKQSEYGEYVIEYPKSTLLADLKKDVWKIYIASNDDVIEMASFLYKYRYHRYKGTQLKKIVNLASRFQRC